MLLFYPIIIAILSIYSFVLVDPNITLINHPFWTLFRNNMVNIGYHNRSLSWIAYLLLIIALYVGHYWLVKNYQKINLLKLTWIIAVVALFSYPFLSHDFFNYLFDARIVTFYHQNPYFYRALDFPADPWLRFMHWTHRTYPYGPLWIVLTLIPSFIAAGKFLINFIFFKMMFAFFYLSSIYYLKKLNGKCADFFATSPLVIVEGLVNNHNDLIAISFAIFGIYMLYRGLHRGSRLAPRSLGEVGMDSPGVANNPLLGRFFILLSAGIKYTTLPTILLQKPSSKSVSKRLNLIALIGTLLLIGYISYTVEIQPWYFLNLLIFLPYFENLIYSLNIFFVGLLVSYYPYIYLGGWDTVDKLVLKHQIIIGFGVINFLWVFFFNGIIKGRTLLRSDPG